MRKSRKMAGQGKRPAATDTLHLWQAIHLLVRLEFTLEPDASQAAFHLSILPGGNAHREHISIVTCAGCTDAQVGSGGFTL